MGFFENVSFDKKPDPLITVVVPSYNHGRYLEQALRSVFSQDVNVEVFVLDAGSQDETLDVIRRWEDRLAGWRSYPDDGQAAAINEGVFRGTAPYVCWLNSDDWLLPGSLRSLLNNLEANPSSPAAYGRVENFHQRTCRSSDVWVEPFDARRLPLRCFISQPGTLIRRKAWEAVSGLDETLSMVLDYDLWWRLYKLFGPLGFVDQKVAVNREHLLTKTAQYRRQHYQEAIRIVKKHTGSVPIKWWLYYPYAVWVRALRTRLSS